MTGTFFRFFFVSLQACLFYFTFAMFFIIQ